MNILCTNSDAKMQFEALSRLEAEYHILCIDRRYDIQVDQDRVLIWQADQRLQLDACGMLVYLLFRAPHEGLTDPAEAVAILEQAELLEDAAYMRSPVHDEAAWPSCRPPPTDERGPRPPW